MDEDVRACQFCPVQAYDEQSKLFLCDDSTLGFAFECVPLAGGEVVVSDCILVGGRASRSHVDAAVTLGHFEGDFSSQFPLFTGIRLAVYFTVSLGGIIKFAPGILFVGDT